MTREEAKKTLTDEEFAEREEYYGMGSFDIWSRSPKVLQDKLDAYEQGKKDHEEFVKRTRKKEVVKALTEAHKRLASLSRGNESTS